jgi:predicted nucleotide-binding protein
MNNIELIEDLKRQAEKITYANEQRDAVVRRAEMLFRKIFGNKTHYLKSLNEIRYSPFIWSGSTPNNVFESSFNDGKKQLINLINVVSEEIQLDAVINVIDKKAENSTNITKTIFIVHGHNEEMKHSVARTITKLKLTPIILHEQPSMGKTIIEKFSENSEVAFAVVLLSADDLAYSCSDKPKNAKLRARQNVIFELGYFIGKLGRERVLALHEVQVNFEIPSDYSGVLFVPFDKVGKWQFDLVKELKALNIPVDANDFL